MIPVGYMAKRVSGRPEWLEAKVTDIYSVSACSSADFAAFINYWKHNGYWFFDSPSVIQRLAKENGIDLAGTKLFYYEVFEREFTEPGQWSPFAPETTFHTMVIPPEKSRLEGYDPVSFYAGTSPECSPLSCNSVASEVAVNEHRLLTSLSAAQDLLDTGRLEHAEPGPYRIFAVYSVDAEWPEPGA